MTQPQPMKTPTDEELNIAICEWRGWRFVEYPLAFPSIEMVKSRFPPEIFEQLLCVDYEQVPNHITGIEALGNMHEAEKGLTEVQFILYANQLSNASASFRVNIDAVTMSIQCLRHNFVSATASQRAIALLRVVKPELFT